MLVLELHAGQALCHTLLFCGRTVLCSIADPPGLKLRDARCPAVDLLTQHVGHGRLDYAVMDGSRLIKTIAYINFWTLQYTPTYVS